MHYLLRYFFELFYVKIGTIFALTVPYNIQTLDLMKLKRVGKKSLPEQKAEDQVDQAAQPQQKLRGEAFISRYAGIVYTV